MEVQASNSTKTKRLRDLTKRSERRLVEYFVIVSCIPRATANIRGANEKGNEEECVGDDESSIVNFESKDNIPSLHYRSNIKRSQSNVDEEEKSRESHNQVAGTMEWIIKNGEEGDEESFFYDTDFEPVITARYPLKDYEGNPLNKSVAGFCFPRGHIRLKEESTMPKVHYFVATGGRGQQMYGTCLTLYEPYLIYQKASTSSEIKQKQVYLPKCLTILSTYPYLVAFREYLTQLHRLTKMGDMPLPLERYISNFCAEIPAPPPGSFEVQTTILDSVIKLWSPPDNQPIAWVSLPFSHLFECLEIDNVITIWHALALERQVLLTSSQLSLLTTCSEILLSLLFPMRWSHAYIPVLPHFLIPILSAPMPYLCGVDRSNLPAVLMELSPSCIIVDLDKNLVNIGPTTPPLPPLPRSYEAKLYEQLDENVGMIFREARSLTKNDDCSESGRHLPIHVKLMADAMWESRLCLFDEAFHLAYTPEAARTNLLNGNDNSALEERDPNDPMAPLRIMTPAEKQSLRKQSQWDAVQEAFLNAYVYILRNYRKFLVFPSKDNDTGSLYGGAGFRSVEFVNSQLYEIQEFLKQLLDTQMFDDFITKRLYGSGEADVTFFDMAVDEFHKNNKLKDILGSNVNSGIRRAGNVASAVTGGNNNGHSSPRHKRLGGIRRAFSRHTRRHSDPTHLRRMRSAHKSLPPAVNSSKNNNSSAKKNQPAEKSEPLLQSARVHRKLKTIVPPEPCGLDLPARLEENIQETTTSTALTKGTLSESDFDDDMSVSSANTTDTRSNKNYPPPSPYSNASGPSSKYKSRQDRLAEALEREKKLCYTYPIFPSSLDEELFGEPRPMSQAVLAEFDRQRDNAARFRRMAMEGDEDGGKGSGAGGKGSGGGKKGGGEHKRQHIRDMSNNMNTPLDPHSAEVATFTVFFMCFTSVVGRELLEMSTDASLSKIDDRAILSTYIPPPASPSSANSSPLSIDSSDDAGKKDDNEKEEEDGNENTHKTNGEADDEKKEANEKDETTTGDEIEADSEKINEDKETAQNNGVVGVNTDKEEIDESNEKSDDKELMETEDVDVGEGEEKEADTNKQIEDTSKPTVDDKGEESWETNEVIAEKEQKSTDDQTVDTVLASCDVSVATGKTAGTSDDDKSPKTSPARSKKVVSEQAPRHRFRDALSTLQIMEAKETAKAQLGIAFEMLTTMKERKLKADPEAYQCLIDACGRCGDTERATQLLGRMHEDGIVADGVVYSCLVSAFSAENAWRKLMGETDEDLPEWANGASVEMDWNKLQKKRGVLELAKNGLNSITGATDGDAVNADPSGANNSGRRSMQKNNSARGIRGFLSRRKRHNERGRKNGMPDKDEAVAMLNNVSAVENTREAYVTEPILRQILLGENLLELIYPDIEIDTDDELCPRCNAYMTDDEVVAGWKPGDSQDYTTKCPHCMLKFVPHFCVQSTSHSFVGSRGPASPLLCERLSPWVLQKELRSVMGDRKGIEDLLSPEWREQENKNAVLWWNLVLSFMRYRAPFSFLLQGSFETNLIAPTPDDGAS